MDEKNLPTNWIPIWAALEATIGVGLFLPIPAWLVIGALAIGAVAFPFVLWDHWKRYPHA
jgi:hypothetical protein